MFISGPQISRDNPADAAAATLPKAGAAARADLMACLAVACLGWAGLLALLLLASVLCGSVLSATEQSPEQLVRTAYESAIRPLLDHHCAKCHGADKHKGDVDFSTYRTGREALAVREVWEKALSQINAEEMPPEKEPQLSDEERQGMAAWIRSLRRLQTPDPGATVIRRLSRAEYERTVRDLFATDLGVGAELPMDSPGEGFDNSVSPLLMEKYLLAADDLLDRLIMPEQMSRHYNAGQLDAIKAGVTEAGTPEGKERRFSGPSEVTTMVDIPSEGNYTIRIRAAAEQAGADPVRLGIRFDTRVVAELRIVARPKYPAVYSCTTQLVAGRTRFSLVFMNPQLDAPVPPAPAPAKNDPAAKAKPPPATAAKAADPAKDKAASEPAARVLIVDAIDITGPPAKSPTDAQRRLFIATPGKDLSKHDAAKAIVAPFAYRAFRRPPLPEEIDGLLKIFALADAQDEDFTAAVKLMLKGVLVSPQFLYRTPDDRDSGPGSGTSEAVAVSDHEFATRLSYFLWGTMPDEELFQLAQGGKLHDPLSRAAQVRRLIMDPRSRALSEGFAGSWLGVDHLATAVVDEKRFPQLTRELRAAMTDEVMTFFESLMRDGGSVLDMLDCNYAYMNALTAKLYDVDGVKGMKMQKVQLSDANRGSLIAMPAVLMATSRSDRTSPVKRGKWVLETLFDASPPPPPPNVAGLDKQDVPENAALTLRQKTERHRTDPACASCHRIMDPIGFGLENFDAIGRWRVKDDTGGVVDALGELPGKRRFSSPADLKRILMGRKDEFVRMLCARILGYALGRHLSGYDEVVVDELASAVAADGYHLDGLIVRLAASYPFINRRALH
jgi:mono/diheme cytochrome c family protein